MDILGRCCAFQRDADPPDLFRDKPCYQKAEAHPVALADTAVHFLLPLFKGEGGYISYITYIYNKWVIALLIAAVLEVYTTHRLSHELEKEKKL